MCKPYEINNAIASLYLAFTVVACLDGMGRRESRVELAKNKLILC